MLTQALKSESNCFESDGVSHITIEYLTSCFCEPIFTVNKLKGNTNRVAKFGRTTRLGMPSPQRILPWPTTRPTASKFNVFRLAFAPHNVCEGPKCTNELFCLCCPNFFAGQNPKRWLRTQLSSMRATETLHHNVLRWRLQSSRHMQCRLWWQQNIKCSREVKQVAILL
jgi:hypothetical protein